LLFRVYYKVVSRTFRIIVVIVAGLAAVAVFYPVNQQRIINVGTDEYAAHHALYGKRIKSQVITINGKLRGIGAVLVNLRRASQLTGVKVAVYTVDNELLAEQDIPDEDIKDDSIAWTNFSDLDIPGRQVRVDFSAPEATKDNPVGLRFELGSPEELALAVRERVPFWRAARQFFVQLVTTYNLGPAILSGLTTTLVMVIIFLVPSLRGISQRWKVGLYLSFLLIIFLVTVGVRMNISKGLKGVSGGDAYNYLSITKQITELKNPLAVEKRLPGWPLLLVPAYLSKIDDIWWMRFLSILSAGGSVVMLALLARKLHLPWSVQVAAPILLSFQKDFFLTSLRPEPYTFYTFLLLLALWLYLSLDHAWAQWCLGITLGFAAMTRQEGLALAVVLILGTLALRKQLWWQGYVRLIIPLFILVLPFFINNAATFGNPFFTSYFEGGRNELVDSWNTFRESAAATWQVLGSLWWRTWSQEKYIELKDPFLLTGGAFALVWLIIAGGGARKRWLGRSWGVLALAMIATSLVATFFVMILRSVTQLDGPLMEFSDAVMKLTAGVMVASVIPFLLHTRWRGVLILLVLVTQVLIALWFHPMPKHFQQDYPLLILMLTTALFLPLYYIQKYAMKQPRRYKVLAITGSLLLHYALLAPLVITIFILQYKITPTIDHLNENSAVDYVIYEANQAAKNLPGPHGFDRLYQISEVYFPDNVFYYRDDLSIEKQQAWIDTTNIRTLMVTNLEPLTMEPMDTWLEVKHIRSEGKKEQMMESWVYEIPQ